MPDEPVTDHLRLVIEDRSFSRTKAPQAAFAIWCVHR
jgi:hypothetical protein